MNLPVTATVVVVVLAAVACADDPPLDHQSLIEGLPAAVLPEAPDLVTDVVCPTPADATIAQTMTCTAAIHGEAITIDLDIDAEGGVAATLRDELLDLTEVEAAAEGRLDDDLATLVDIRCPGTVVVVRPGTRVDCTGTSGGRQREMVVEIVDADGGWTIAFAG